MSEFVLVSPEAKISFSMFQAILPVLQPLVVGKCHLRSPGNEG